MGWEHELITSNFEMGPCLATLTSLLTLYPIPGLLSGEHLEASLINGTRIRHSGQMGHMPFCIGLSPQPTRAFILASTVPLGLRSEKAMVLGNVCPLLFSVSHASPLLPSSKRLYLFPFCLGSSIKLCFASSLPLCLF